MKKEDKIANLYLAVLLPVAVTAIGWSVYRFPIHTVSVGLVTLSFITVCFSSYLRIQLPRTKIHLTVSDALVFLSLLVYGGEVAVLLAAFESTFTSINFRRQGVTIRPKTILTNISISAFSVFATSLVLTAIFGSPFSIIQNGNYTEFVWLLAVMALAQFFINSICVSAFVSLRSGSSPWKVWNEYCLNAMVLYVCGAVMAGVGAKAISQINFFLFVAVISFFALVYFTYRRYLKDVTDTAAKAERAERERAEQAERHVKELQHYVHRLEESGEELRSSHDRLRHAAYHDALTGLPNRTYFLETITSLLKECYQMTGRPFAVLYLDLNRFKTINDSFGHTRGDKLIQHVADRLKETVGPGNIVGRFSGDEFAVIISEFVTDRDVIGLANRVVDRLAEPFLVFGREVYTSTSVGIAFGNRDYKKAENILRDADIAMYQAKDSSRKYVVFNEDMHQKAVDLMQLETDLRIAVERNEFEVYYQPIVSLENMSLAGFEALVRWNHPRRGIVSPSDFIPVSESTGLIVPITVFILEESCRQVSQWVSTGSNERLFVSVNLSGQHFHRADLVKQIGDIIVLTGIDPKHLKLEITETSVMENADTVISTLHELRRMGMQLSIDDFGTGYSSLNYLHRFPIDTLKIDRSFVSSIELGSENSEIVKTIVYLAKALGLTVVAEGIENLRQLNHLRALGCEYGQGYLFSRPLPAREAESLIYEGLDWRGLMLPDDGSLPKQSWPGDELRLVS